MRILLGNAGAGAACIILLLGAYCFYERDVARVSALLSTKVQLRVPLEQLPLSLDDWVGSDLPQDAVTARIAGADEQLSRVYRNIPTGTALSVYLAYYGNPRPRVSHHPEVCYRAFGWQKEAQSEERIPKAGSAKGGTWPITVFRFRKGAERTTVVSLYGSGGKWFAERQEVDVLAHHAVSAEVRHYFLRIMISMSGSPPRELVVRMAGQFLNEMLPALDAHLPVLSGDVAGAQQE